jgi:hypothetical protein
MFRSSNPRVQPLPAEFLAWQVALRKHTMDARHGAPHAGVAPLVLARRPGTTLEVRATRSSAACCRASIPRTPGPTQAQSCHLWLTLQSEMISYSVWTKAAITVTRIRHATSMC